MAAPLKAVSLKITNLLPGVMIVFTYEPNAERDAELARLEEEEIGFTQDGIDSENEFGFIFPISTMSVKEIKGTPILLIEATKVQVEVWGWESKTCVLRLEFNRNTRIVSTTIQVNSANKTIQNVSELKPTDAARLVNFFRKYAVGVEPLKPVNIPKGQEDAITFQEIQDGEEMADFKKERDTFHRFYTKKTYEEGIRPTMRVPHTQERLELKDVSFYTAKLDASMTPFPVIGNGGRRMRLRTMHTHRRRAGRNGTRKTKSKTSK